MDLHYRAGSIDDLRLDECVVRATRDRAARWWQLWAWVRNEINGEPGYVAVPVTPGGSYAEVGLSGRRTWGLRRVGAGLWQVAPSIDAKTYVDAHGREVAKITPGAREVSWWHKTPRLIGVPDSEPWAV